VINLKPLLKDDQGDPCIVMDSKVSLPLKRKVAGDLLSGSASQPFSADISERLGKS
jgi:hypothetical protein